MKSMEKKHLKQILKSLQKASKNKRKKDRERYIDSCSDSDLHAICGACKNFLENNISMTNKQKTYLKKRLYKFKKDIRKLSKPQTPVKKKRELLKRDQIGKGVFSLLAGFIIPSIISAIAGQ